MTVKYLVCTQQLWGEEAYERVRSVRRREEDWTILSILDGTGATFNLPWLVWQIKPRYAFFLNWSDKVPDDVLRLSECVNFHCTPLPFGRGGHPIENMLLRGFTTTTLTAYRMTDVLDAGPIYRRYSPVSLLGTKPEILTGFIDPVALLIRDIVEHEPLPLPQEGAGVIFKRLSPAAYARFWDGRRTCV